MAELHALLANAYAHLVQTDRAHNELRQSLELMLAEEFSNDARAYLFQISRIAETIHILSN